MSRRARPWPALIALLVAPLAVAAAAVMALTDDRTTHVPSLPLAVGDAKAASRPPDRAPQIALDGVDAFHLRFHKPPRAGLLFDLGSGEVLWRRRPLARLPIASLTKIMTAILVAEHSRPDDRVRITRAALHYQGSAIGVLPKGRRVRLETLLNGLMIVSGNDAAIALSVHLSGSERRFVAAMNRRAGRLGLRCTHFVSPHGLENGNRSCPRDLAVLARIAMAEPRIRRVVRRAYVSFRFPIKGHRLFLSGHNPLIRAGYRGAIGLKTGYTDAAGRCFVGVARRRGRTLGVVLLGSANPAKHAAKLLDLGFASG
jgi:serine-type D-Ala-D-Ala carboxypeptidase (penicillin-binding protein 5/6)